MRILKEIILAFDLAVRLTLIGTLMAGCIAFMLLATGLFCCAMLICPGDLPELE